MTPFDSAELDDHEQVSFFCDAASGLRAIVAIHTTAPFGIAGGGCRMQRYPSHGRALEDALRLSRVMSYKLALLDMPVGGAKTVVIGDPARDKSEALLLALGRAVECLGGRYVIATDVGTSAADMEVVARATRHVAAGGDSSTGAALGVLAGIHGAIARRLKRRDLEGVHVAVQGLGNVGRQLCELLAKEGARLTVADIDPEAVQRSRGIGAEAVSVESILETPCDVLSPCALGDVIDDQTIGRLRCKVVAGAANNQLARADHADALAARGILYAPDFVINAGGIVGAGFDADVHDERIRAAMGVIAGVLEEVFARAERDGLSTHAAAVALARERIQQRR